MRSRDDGDMDSTANLQGASSPQRRRHIWRYWTFAFSALTVATALLISIIVVLVKYDGQQLPHWPWSITLNTLVALLSTVYRASIVVVLADVIGQAKWHWFRDAPRPLDQLQVYDDASRGPWGSLKLVHVLRFGFRGNPLALVAALTTILSLAVGPLSQQAVKSTTCAQTLYSETGRIATANTSPGDDAYYRIGAGMWELGPGMKGAMINGITNPFGSDSAVEYSCPTGNCTFQTQNDIPHATAAMCSQCMELTDLVEIQESLSETYPSNLTLGTLTINEASGMDWLVSAGIDLAFAEPHMSDEFKDLASQALSNITILTISTAPCQGEGGCPHSIGPDSRNDYVAATCSLYPCMQSFKAKVERGNLVEDVVSVSPARVDGSESAAFINPASSEYVAIQQPCVIDEQIYDAGNFSLVPNRTDTRAFRNSTINGETVLVPTDCYYTFSGIYVSALQGFIADSLFSGNCSMQSAQAGSINCGDEWWLSTLWKQNNATFDTLHKAVDDWATAVSNFIRSDGYGPLNVTADSVGMSNLAEGGIEGLVHETTVCVSLDWPWLLVPGLLCLVTIVLLASTLVLSYTEPEQEVWLSNILPLLFFGLSSGADRTELPSEDWKDIVDTSSQTLVRLKHTVHGRSAFVLVPRMPAGGEYAAEEYEMESDFTSTFGRTDTMRTDSTKR